MKLINVNIKNIVLFVLFFLIFSPGGYSQGTNVMSAGREGLYFGLNIFPSQTALMLSSTDTTISDFKTAKKNTLSGSVEIGYQFSKYLGLSTGIGLSTFVSCLELSKYANRYDTIDSEGETYKRLVSGRNINETQRISYLNIPLMVNLELPFNDQLSFYLQTGINFSMTLNNKFNSTGTFSYTGYYSIYDITFENIQYEKLLPDQAADCNGKLKVKSFSPELMTSGGFSYTTRNRIQFLLGIFYNRMLNDISGYTSSGSFRLSSTPNQMRSLMEGSTKVTARSVGIKLSFRYYFK